MSIQRIGDRITAPAIRDGHRTYDMGGRWGFNITVSTTPAPGQHGMWSREYSHTGCWTPIPRVGDILLVKMQSGKIGVLVFHEVTPWHDPPDGFEAKSVMSGYQGEVKLPNANAKGVTNERE